MKTFEERTSWMEREPKNGWNEVKEGDKEVAREMCVRRFGSVHGGKMEFSGRLFAWTQCDYEFWCKMMWCVGLRYKPLPHGDSYKKAMMDLCGVRFVG